MNKELLKRIIVENQEFVNDIELIDRDLNIEKSGNYVFVGSRRSGKTYCMFQVMREFLKEISSTQILYINFEDERLLECKSEHLQLIIDAYKEMFSTTPVLFLDEIQIIDGWEKFVRRLADHHYRVFVTGSNAKMLSREIATTLGGRFIVKEIFPLSFAEYLKANRLMLDKQWEYGSKRYEVRRLFDTYFRFGGFPELLNFKEKRIWLDNLYQKIFYGDLIARYKVRNDFALKLMIKKLAENIHDEVSFNRIRNIIQSTGTKIGVTTVIEYISFLEESYLIHSVRNYLAKISERESQKKYFFVDNGILSLFVDSPESILLENQVACELWRRYGNDFYFAKDVVEVDFFIPHLKTLIQVAYNMSNPETEKREVESMLKIKTKLDAEILMVLTLDDERTIERDGNKIICIPIWKWLINNDKWLMINGQ